METKHLTQEELDQVNQINQGYRQIVNALGQVNVQMLELQQQKSQLEQQYNQLKQTETELSIQLEENYGKGNINLETGEFTPIES
jgi:uncharacterized protein involved in exopolysaccharide biosynthesis